MSGPENAVLKPEYGRGLIMPSVIVVIALTIVAVMALSSASLVAAFCICIALVAVFRFEWFLYAHVFLLPWNPFVNTSLLLHDVSLALHFVLFGGVWIIRMHEGRSIKDWLTGTRIKKGVLVFASIATISLLASALGPATDSLRLLGRLLSYVALFFAISGWVESREEMQRMIKVILWSGILVVLFGFYQVLINGYSDLYFYLYPLQEDGLEPWNGRITSLLFHFNSLAGYLNLILPLSLACMVLGREATVRRLSFAFYAMGLAALYFTGSRGGLIACAATLLICFGFLRSRRVVLFRIVAAIVAAAAIVVLLQLPSQLETESASRLQQIDEFTSVSRLALWGAAGAMFFEHPVMGVGYGNYRLLYNDYVPGISPGQLDAHNIYLQVLSETGSIGFLAFFFLIFALVLLAIKLARIRDPLYRVIGIGIGGALAATLIHGMVDYLFNTSPQFGGTFWVLMALGVVAFDRWKLLVEKPTVGGRARAASAT